MGKTEINDIKEEILQLKKKRGAVILAHNYQLPEIQEAADYVGDSLGLAQKAAKITEPVIVMCGVYFMAETAALLNPGKTVVIPDKDAGCPLADFASEKMVLEWRARYPGHAFVAYVNTTAEVKSAVDVCCTSANAVEIVKKLPQKKIVFLPDKNLGAYVKKMVPEKEIVLWPGFCVVHEKADLESILKAKKMHPQALILAHPECPMEILDTADAVLSTGQMFDFVEKHPENDDFIIVTEWGINYALKKRFNNKNFIEPLKRMECANMKKITLMKLLNSLKTLETRVKVKPDVAETAGKSIERMLEMMQ